MADNTNDLSVGIGADPSDLRRGMQEAERIIESSSQRIRSSIERIGNLGQQLAGLGATLTASLTLPILGLATASVKAYGDIQALQKGLEAVMGSAAGAQSEFNKLKEVAKLPGLGLPEAVKGSINLQAIGIDANKSRKILLQFGNAVATVGKGRAEFERAIYGVQQLANTDFPLGEDLNIIKDALPQVSNLLKEAFGSSRSDELTALGITSQQVLDVILTGLGKLPRVSGGIKGAFENLSDAMKISLGRIGKIIDDAFDLSSIVDKITGFVDRIVSAFEGLNPNIQKVILIVAGLVAALGPLLLAVGGFMALLPTLTAGVTALGAVFTALLIPIGLVTIAIVGIVAAVVANWDKIRPYLEETIDRFKRLYNESTIFRTVLGSIGFQLESIAKISIVALKSIYENFKSLGRGVLEIFGSIGDVIEGVLTFDFKLIQGGLIRGFATIGTTTSRIFSTSNNAFKEIGGIIDTTAKKYSDFRFDLSKKTDLGIKVGETLTKDIENSIVAGVKTAKVKIKKPEIEALTAVDLAPRGLLNGLGEEFKTLNDLMFAETLRTNMILGTSLPLAFTDGLQKAKDAIDAANLEDRIKELNDTLSNTLSSGVVNGITDTFSAIGTAIAEGGNVINAVGKTLLGSFGKLLQELGKNLIQYGVGMLAVKLAMKNPYLAIAAGAALVALGAGLSAATNKSVNDSGIGGGNISSASGVSTENFSASNTTSQGFSGGEYVFRLSGTDLIAAFNRNVSAQDRVTA